MRLRSFLLLLALVALPAWGQTPPAQTLTLSDAVRRALDANLSLQRQRSEVNAADLQRRSILAAVLPKIGIQGSTTQNSDEVTFGSDSDARTILPSTDWTYRLAFTQPIYAGFRERRALQQARLGVDSAQQGVMDVEDQVLTRTVAEYLVVLEGEALLAVEEKNLDLTRNRQKQVRDLYEAGEITRVEVLRAESDIKEAERRIAAARQVRDAAESRLRLVLSLDTADSIRVSDPGQLFPNLPPVQALVTEAEHFRPEVALAETNLEIARLEVLKQKGAALPVVSAEGGWVNQRSSFPTDEYGYFRVNVNVPLYQGGEVAARTAQAQERFHQAQLLLQEVKLEVREQVRLALLDLETADANLRLAREQLAASEAEYEQASEL
ncbi:MAG TPA: TolC family protein, partial [Thermoanaerobaculia bacterium]|nr:TolC family protein [Thermoanaerobaculia bacterium]